MFLLRMMGIVAPPKSAPLYRRILGPIAIVGMVIALVLVGLAIVELIAIPFGGVTLGAGLLYGILLVAAALGILVFFGRRKQQRVRAR